MVGIRASRGNNVITMDGDGQHPPEVIIDLVDAQRRNAVDVVYAIRSRSTNLPFLKRFTSRLFYKFVKLATRVPVEPGQADFRLISQAVRNELIENKGPTVLRIEVPQLGFPSARISYIESERSSGRTKFTRKKMLEVAFSFLYDTSSLPLRAVSALALLLSVVTGLWIFVVIVTFATSQTISGWASVMTAVLILGSAITALLAIQGQYLARVYELGRGIQSVRVRHEFSLDSNQEDVSE
jgi:dolichol-phosphate mannosyltransferase